MEWHVVTSNGQVRNVAAVMARLRLVGLVVFSQGVQGVVR